MSDLNNKVALITGAAGGIGLGLARACADRGMRLILSDLDGVRLTDTVTGLRDEGNEVLGQQCDVRDLAEVAGLRDEALREFGSIDLVCNNAGIGLAKPVLGCTTADWHLLFEVNVTGVINGIRTFLPVLIDQGGGHLSATASLSGLVGDPDLAIYSGTKFAVVGMMESIAIEMQRDHPAVTVSVLCPGPVATGLVMNSARALTDAGTSASDNPDVADYLAAGMHPDDVGRLAIAGIEAGDFWLLSHPELTFEIAEPRFEAMRRHQLHIPQDWTRQ